MHKGNPVPRIGGERNSDCKMTEVSGCWQQARCWRAQWGTAPCGGRGGQTAVEFGRKYREWQQCAREWCIDILCIEVMCTEILRIDIMCIEILRIDVMCIEILRIEVMCIEILRIYI